MAPELISTAAELFSSFQGISSSVASDFVLHLINERLRDNTHLDPSSDTALDLCNCLLCRLDCGIILVLSWFGVHS